MDPFKLKEEHTFETYLATVGDEEDRSELVRGKIVLMAPASPRHSFAQAKLTQMIGSFLEKNKVFNPKTKDPEDTWRYVVEAWTYYGLENCLSHDLAAFSAKELTKIPEKGPIKVLPIWVCEILSPSNWSTDTETKRIILQNAGVPYYWIVDPMRKSIAVFVLDSSGEYRVSSFLGESEGPIRLEPFKDLEIRIGDIFS